MARLVNRMYQYSVINALAAGEASRGIPVSELPKHGSIGLGTWAQMKGELVMIDHNVYEMLGNGTVQLAPQDRIIPYAVASEFESQRSKKINLDANYTANDAIADLFPESKNNFITYVIRGTFSAIKARAVGGQQYPGQTLSEVAKTQSVFDFADITGDMVGFKSPEPFGGVSVTGKHTHFISADRKHGGHVLAVTAKDVTIEAAVASELNLELPTTEEYNKLDLNVPYEHVSKVE